MSLSLHVMGFVPPDEKWREMKEVWDACKKANVEVPESVSEFFGGQDPDPSGLEVEVPTRDYHGDWESGFEVDLDKIPANVKTLRFIVSS